MRAECPSRPGVPDELAAMNQDAANQATSGRDVFVSYASQDVAVANSIVENLEAHGLKCWIAIALRIRCRARNACVTPMAIRSTHAAI